MNEEVYDILIIGGGPAGMTAGLYAIRKNLRVLLIAKDFGGQALWAPIIENYMGHSAIPGSDLMMKFQRQISSLPIKMRVPDEVIALRKEGEIFIAETRFGGLYKAKVVIVATGKRAKTLNIPGEKELTGRGVSYCITCDAPLFANKIVAVVGGGNSAVTAALDLAKTTSKVYLIVRKAIRADQILQEKLAKAEKVEKIIGFSPKKIKGEERVEGMVIRREENGEEREIKIDGVFVEIGLIPNTDFLKDRVRMNKLREIMINCNCETSLEGIFACGDVTNVAGKQIIIACGEGAKAALSAYHYLLRK